jgi:hypothetical protein
MFVDETIQLMRPLIQQLVALLLVLLHANWTQRQLSTPVTFAVKYSTLVMV